MKTTPPAPDRLARGVALGGNVRFALARTTAIARELVRLHDAGPLGALALGRVATGALLLGAHLKHRQQIGVQVNGAGPLGEIYAIADGDGHVRASIDAPRAEPVGETLRLGPALLPGRLTITRRLSEDQPAYRGIVELVTGEIGDDLAHYLLGSEQIPSAVAVAERLGPEGVEAAGGFLVQALPGAAPEALDAIIDRIEALPPLADLIADGSSFAEILGHLFDDATILAETDLAARCPCSREHFARRLVTLGSAELERLTAEQAITEVECHFCRSRHVFDREQMNALLYGARMYEQAN